MPDGHAPPMPAGHRCGRPVRHPQARVRNQQVRALNVKDGWRETTVLRGGFLRGAWQWVCGHRGDRLRQMSSPNALFELVEAATTTDPDNQRNGGVATFFVLAIPTGMSQSLRRFGAALLAGLRAAVVARL